MAQYLLDTNILLRASDAGSDKQSLAQGAFEAVISQGHTCFLTAQVIGEYYSVVTRPISSNGFGWDTERGKLERDLWIARFSFLEETAEIFPRWIDLIDKFKVTGRRIFDLRILAVMRKRAVNSPYLFSSYEEGVRLFSCVGALVYGRARRGASHKG